MIHLIRERELGPTLTSPGDMWDLGFSLSGPFSDPGRLAVPSLIFLFSSYKPLVT